MAVQHDIGAHALVANAHATALVAPDGNVAWLCWPRVDADPCLLSLLDGQRGGDFVVAPRTPAVLDDEELADSALAATARTSWRIRHARLVVDDVLTLDGPQRLVRLARADEAPVPVGIRLRPTVGWGRAPATVAVDAVASVATFDEIGLRALAPAPWRRQPDGGVSCEVVVHPGRPVAVVLGDADDRGLAAADYAAVVADVRTRWRRLGAAAAAAVGATGLGVEVLGLEATTTLVARCAVVLAALRQRRGGIVAAPTTSLPQWPRSSRTWDYRYAWVRDTALAALALLRARLVEEAQELGDFCGRLGADGDLPVLCRVDGTPPPPETTLDHLAGYRGARPVRRGNAAASQTQVDVAGGVLDLAWALWRADALPPALAAAVPRIADRLATTALAPDHGIWEIRGEPRRYTHSAVMAWAGLRRAARLRRHRVIGGDAARWEATADRIRRQVLAGIGPEAPLQLLVTGEGGADAALALVPLVGFLAPGDPRTAATLTALAELAAPCGLLHRYRGERDGLADPCAPFVFPTFWLAAARRRCGGDAASPFLAASRAAGRRGFFAEVGDPLTAEPLGNYPQIQSHAACILAATHP